MSSESQEQGPELEQLRAEMREYLRRVFPVITNRAEEPDPRSLWEGGESEFDREMREEAVAHLNKFIDREISLERDGIQSFEQFEEEISAVGQKMLTLTGKPELVAQYKHKGEVDPTGWTDEQKKLFEGERTDHGVNARRAKLLTDGIARGDATALTRVPRDCVKMKNEDEGGSNLDSLTSGGYNTARDFYHPFADENTGRHIVIASAREGVNGWLYRRDENLAEEIDRVVDFLHGRRQHINREIVLSNEFTKAVEAAKTSDPKRKDPATLTSLQHLYYQMEIQHADEVVPLGQAIEKLYRMQDAFETKILDRASGTKE